MNQPGVTKLRFERFSVFPTIFQQFQILLISATFLNIAFSSHS